MHPAAGSDRQRVASGLCRCGCRSARIHALDTPPQYRGHGYGSAVTAAAASWAQQSCAKHVVLSTDLANPISNAIYPRIGFRPVHDAAEIAFTPAP